MTIPGQTERAAYPAAARHDKQSHDGRDKGNAGPNEPAGKDHMVEEELAAATDDGDDPVAEANDEVEVGKAPEPEHEVPIAKQA